MSKASDDKTIIQKVRDYFYGNEDFANKFEKWANDHCDVVDSSSDEHRLEYTELYRDFVAMFEKGLEDYIESEGSTVMEFYERLRKEVESDQEGEDSFFARVLLATSDYDVFIEMMKHTKMDKRNRALLK